ncbi:MAG: IS66 family transposase [Betaproteobacteria bacterium]|nr:IS66 family transposase [Betaproteobacteria bacterium]
MHTHAPLPNNVEELQALLLAQISIAETLQRECDGIKLINESHDAEIARLNLLIDKLKRMLFGRKSEKLAHQIDQLELELEELYIARAQSERLLPAVPEPVEIAVQASAPKRAWPESLPREILRHVPDAPCCPDCGGAWQTLGEDISEVLEHVPASIKVIRHVRPKLACTKCDTIAQAAAPSRPIAKGAAGPGLLAHIMVSKYLDHQPIYRQCRIHARNGIELAESTVGDWVGNVHALLRPLANALQQYVLSAEKLHTDDTPIAVLAPGTGKTKQARLWTYVRDDRPAGVDDAPAVWFAYSENRQGIHPQTHLKDFAGILQADAYVGYDAVYASGKVIEAACWAHARRKFHDIHVQHPSAVTTQTLAQMAQLYQIEATIRGSPAEERQAIRQDQAKPLVEGLHRYLSEQQERISRKSVTAEAIGYAMNHWVALTRYLDDGRIEIDNNAAERSLRGIALGRKNYLFLGSNAGGERAATLYSLLETAKLNGMNPESYLRDVLTVIADYPVNRVAELLPWHVQAKQKTLAQEAASG